RDARGDTRGGQERRVVPVAPDGSLEVAPGIELEGGLPISEQIVGDPYPRIDVVVPDHALRFRKDQRRREETSRPYLLLRVVAPGVAVSNRTLQGQLPAGPLILRIERVHPNASVRLVWKQILSDLVRNAVVEAVGEIVIVR